MLLPLRTIVSLSLVGVFALAGCQTGSRTASSPADPVVPKPAQERAQALTDQGKQLKTEGYTAQALDAFSEAVQENPQLTEAHLNIGTIFRERGIYDKADQAYRKAVVSDPNNFDARYLLGLTNQLKGDLPRAISSYKRALIIKKDSYEANRDMGSAILQSGRPAEAIGFAKRAVELNPDSQSGWANLATAYLLNKDYENAVGAYRQTLELGDAVIPVMLGLADAHLNLGNFQRAENVLRAIEREGGNTIARERMGLVLFKQRKFEAAAEAYRSALVDNPSDTASLNGLGITLMATYLRGGEEDDAMRLEALSLWRRSLGLRSEQGSLIDLISRYSEE